LRIVPVKYSIFIFSIVLILFIGCGIKGNPVVSVPEYRQLVQNMKVVSSGDTIILTWNFFNKDEKINYIAVEKSEAGSAGNECKNCPRTFERIGQVSVKGIKADNKEADIFSFTDKKVIKGKTYNYRLMLCGDSGICSEGCTAEINYK
jgi:hypothetical protein